MLFFSSICRYCSNNGQIKRPFFLPATHQLWLNPFLSISHRERKRRRRIQSIHSLDPLVKMARRAIRYAVVDAFTDTPFKGNPAAVCFLEQHQVDEQWMQAVAVEFNISQTAFVTPAAANGSLGHRFHLRWFTPVAEVDLCGHATLASAHFLFTSGLAKCDMIEFATKSGILTAKKVHGLKQLDTSMLPNSGEKEKFRIELDLPVISVAECDSTEIPSIPQTLNGVEMVTVQKTRNPGDLIVELSSGKDVADIQPKYDELQKCAGRGVIITGPAPPGSGYDFFSRFFCPKLGIDEDPVCGSAHCALAPYWSRKLKKHKLIAYMASPRGGRLDLQWEEDTQRVRIQGEAIVVMEGSLLV